LQRSTGRSCNRTAPGKANSASTEHEPQSRPAAAVCREDNLAAAAARRGHHPARGDRGPAGRPVCRADQPRRDSEGTSPRR
jgi:hypothetical protein